VADIGGLLTADDAEQLVAEATTAAWAAAPHGGTRTTPLGPRRRGRGVVGTVATASVVGGTMGAVQHHQQKKWAAQEQQAYQARVDQQQAQQAAYEQGQAEAAAPASAGADMMVQLNQLAQLHQAGVLDDAEFAAAKANLLA
jgi:hypothetical protein